MKVCIGIPLIVLSLLQPSLIYAPPLGWRSEVGLTGYCTAPHFDPRIAVSSAGIHVISRNEGELIRCWEAVYNRSTDTGVCWSNGYAIESEPHTGHDRSVDIAANSDYVRTIYELMDLSGNIKYRRSTNGGTDWNTSVEVVS